LLGPRRAEARAPTVAVALNEPAEPVAARLAPFGIMTGGGSFYANRCLEAQGVDLGQGALRFSFVHYTSPEEIAQLIRALDEVMGRGRQ
jgi:selenocysteine lyase/cysteine desulfurase